MRLRRRKTKQVSPNALDDGDVGKLYLFLLVVMSPFYVGEHSDLWIFD